MNETTPSHPLVSAPPNDEEDDGGGICVAGKDPSRGRISPSSSEEGLEASSPPDDDGNAVGPGDHLTIAASATADDGNDAGSGSEEGRRPFAGRDGGGDAASPPAVGDGISHGPRMDDAGGTVESARSKPADGTSSSAPVSVSGGGVGHPPRRQGEDGCTTKNRGVDFVSASSVDGGDAKLTSFLAARDGFRLEGVARKRNAQQSTDDGEDGTEEGEETSPWIHGADATASALARGADLFRRGLAASVVPRVSSALDAAGGLAMAGAGVGAADAVAADPPAPSTDDAPGEGRRRRRRPDRDAVVARAYAGAARRASGGVLRASRCVALGACDAATGAIHAAKRKVADDDGGRIGKMMVPDRQDREILVASGRVALAGLGAAAVVAESLYDATRAIARKGATVTADVVEHKYGEDTRELIEDTSEALGNTIEAVTFVHMMEAAALTNAIARNTGKESIKHDMDRD